jgi:hypothetical protein
MEKEKKLTKKRKRTPEQEEAAKRNEEQWRRGEEKDDRVEKTSGNRERRGKWPLPELPYLDADQVAVRRYPRFRIIRDLRLELENAKNTRDWRSCDRHWRSYNSLVQLTDLPRHSAPRSLRLWQWRFARLELALQGDGGDLQLSARRVRGPSSTFNLQPSTASGV